MKWIFKGICVAAVGTLAIIGFGYITMHLWNWVVPGLTGWHMLDWWHAIGLLVLCKILFGGFKGGRGCGGCGHRGKWGRHRHGMWKKRWDEKMANMTPEEKEKMMAKMNKCGWGGKWNDENCETDSSKESDSKI